MPSTTAPVLLVVHELFGMSTWVRTTTGQLAARHFMAIRATGQV